MSGLSRVGAAVRRGAALLVPAGRRDWVEAVWAEAPEAPPGLQRLAWRAGGARLIAREALMRRGIRGAMLFAVAAAVAAWAAWPGSSASSATPADRAGVIIMVLLLAGLPLLTRWFLGPPDNRAARWLRAGCYAGFLALIPAQTTVEQFVTTPPRGGVDLRLYRLIAEWTNRNSHWPPEIVFLALMALYLAAILWMTSRRSRIAPATLAAGTGAGIALGLVMYAVAPLGLSSAATDPWLPGSDVDPLVLLAWLLVFGGPVAAAVVADRCCTTSSSSPLPVRDRFRQMMAAGLLTSLAGALLVTVLGTGTTAAVLKEAWLRNWLYNGQHSLYGVQDVSFALRTLPAIAYSHELTGAVDTGALLAMCIIFPVIALLPTAVVAAGRTDDHTPTPGDPRRGGGGPPGPEPTPDLPGGGQSAVTDNDADWLVADLADAAHQPAGMR
jgi:hypothetical protein